MVNQYLSFSKGSREIIYEPRNFCKMGWFCLSIFDAWSHSDHDDVNPNPPTLMDDKGSFMSEETSEGWADFVEVYLSRGHTRTLTTMCTRTVQHTLMDESGIRVSKRYQRVVKKVLTRRALIVPLAAAHSRLQPQMSSSARDNGKPRKEKVRWHCGPGWLCGGGVLLIIITINMSRGVLSAISLLQQLLRTIQTIF